MGAPQIVWIALATMSLGVSLAKDGEPQKPHSFVRTAIGATLAAGILYWGGFFS